jgi:trehalose-6-phosphate synthase
MDPDEAEGRLRQLYGIVENHDVDRWGRDFLAAVRESGPQRKTNTSPSVSATLAAASGRSQNAERAARA